MANVGQSWTERVVMSHRLYGWSRPNPALRMPRRCSAFSSPLSALPKVVSASSSITVTALPSSEEGTERTSAAAEMSEVISGCWTSSPSTSRSRDLPQRFTGDLMTSRAANSRHGMAHVAAANRVTAHPASADGNTT